MKDKTPHRRSKRTAALLVGSLVAVILATGLGAISFASGTSAKRRPPAITGSIHLNHRDVRNGRTVSGELVFENHTSRTQVLMRGCKIDGLYAIALRASDGYIQEPAFSLVACSPVQEMVAKPGTTVYRFKMPATYTGCSQTAEHQPPKSSRYWSPLCLKDSSGERNIMPPVPAGKYTALFFPGAEWHGLHVKAADLVVTRN